MHSHINFGYPWQITYGYLFVTAVALPLFLLSWHKHWPKIVSVLLAAATLWSLAAFSLMRFALDINGRMPLPTEAFLRSGSGRVLDIGAGTGRSTLMVLEARPQTTVVALDSFSDSYVGHFGSKGTGQSIPDQGRERLMANLRAAGVDNRASVEAADMRQLPFPPASFDGIVSAYTFEHLRRKGIQQAMTEASRVLKPGGEFLLVVLSKDLWLTLMQGPIAMHSHLPGRDAWMQSLHDAGFQVVEDGTRPGTMYFLARKS